MRRRSDRGAAAVEFMGMIGFFILMIMACFVAYAAFGAVEGVENATRTGARVASTSPPGERVYRGTQAASAALPSWLNSHQINVQQVDDDTVRCQISARVPVLVRGIDLDIRITRRVEMPVS
ncbi:hypothetical protein DPM19_15770 [Actinomadura craniellae]|uniref:Pilus assembly protein n=1 Tax=Actinomadura craniellae TaxID=2231787 RepID=A0A365H5N1_9ACTN|nr:TadE family protein [Actinomadura craniellae]RAY14414.1 hypothetical protein DPM19_15770 [Actinomadura craniellae]